MTKETIAVMQDEAIHCVEARKPVSWVSADLVVWCAVPYGKTKWLRAKIFTAVTEAFKRVAQQAVPMLESFPEVPSPMHGLAAKIRDASARNVLVARTWVTTRDAVIAALRSSTGLAYLDPAVLSEVKRAHKHKATVHKIFDGYLEDAREWTTLQTTAPPRPPTPAGYDSPLPLEDLLLPEARP